MSEAMESRSTPNRTRHIHETRKYHYNYDMPENYFHLSEATAPPQVESPGEGTIRHHETLEERIEGEQTNVLHICQGCSSEHSKKQKTSDQNGVGQPLDQC